MREGSALLHILILAVASACRATAPEARRARMGDLPEPAPRVVELASLGSSLDALRADFNAARDRARVIGLFSPSELQSLSAAQALRRGVLRSFPDADVWVGCVWIDLMSRDCRASAERAAAEFEDPRVRHFHDPEKRASRAVAEELLPTALAWDVFLFYPAGVVWEDALPAPSAWSHQLGPVEEEHACATEALIGTLEQALLGVVRPSSRPPGVPGRSDDGGESR